LLDEFGNAVREVLQLEVLQLHERQFLAIVEGDAESNRFDLLIHVANERKQRAKYDYMRHVEAHGCTGQKMPLSKLEREVITDSMLKVQSIQSSLENIDDAKIPAAEDIHDCLEEADPLRKSRLFTDHGGLLLTPGASAETANQILLGYCRYSSRRIGPVERSRRSVISAGTGNLRHARSRNGAGRSDRFPAFAAT
jgi:hypothetical protein